MPRTDRTRQAADERFDPIAHVVLEPLTGPAPSRATSKAGAQPPRPQNAWILYRAWALNGLLDKQPELRGKPQSQISKLLGQQWANETPEIRKHFEHQANLQKERHAQEYPNYVFKPQKKEDKEREREVKKKERARVRETEKLKKEIAKALRSGHVPQAVTGVPEGGTGEPTHATAESELHKFAVYTFDELGPSPPMSMCPSPDEIPKELPEGEEQEEALFDASETSAPENEVEMAVASSSKTTLDSNSESSTEQRSPLAVAPWVFSSSTPGKTQDAGSSSSSALGLAQGFDAYLKQCFPSFDPDEPSNHLEMPSGNLMLGPGFIHDDMRANEAETNSLPSVPGGNMFGIRDELAGSSAVNPLTQTRSGPPNEGLFMQPFLGPAGLDKHLMRAGEQVDDLLLDEREAAVNGERILAAEHISNGAPSMTVDDSDSSSNPSPPGSSTLVSPDIAPPFDFARMHPPDLHGPKDSMFNDFSFSDGMMGIAPWDATIGIEMDQGLGLKSPGPCGPNFRATLASLPMMSMSTEPSLGLGFETGKVSTGMIPIGDTMECLGEPPQHEDRNWLPATLNGPVSS